MLTGERLRLLVYETESIFKRRHRASARDPLAPSLTLALVRRADNAVGSLPRSVVVEGRAAAAVVAGGVVPAHTLAVDLPVTQQKEG